MRWTAASMSVALAVGIATLLPLEAEAQNGGGLLPGANGQQKLDGGAVTTCSARNALGTKQCTTTCQAGQSADCEDSDDASDPTCACSGG